MQKYQPFEWLRNKYTKRLHNINSISHITYSININNSVMFFDSAFNEYNFADGTPFEIKETK